MLLLLRHVNALSSSQQSCQWGVTLDMRIFFTFWHFELTSSMIIVRSKLRRHSLPQSSKTEKKPTTTQVSFHFIWSEKKTSFDTNKTDGLRTFVSCYILKPLSGEFFLIKKLHQAKESNHYSTRNHSWILIDDVGGSCSSCHSCSGYCNRNFRGRGDMENVESAAAAVAAVEADDSRVQCPEYNGRDAADSPTTRLNSLLQLLRHSAH